MILDNDTNCSHILPIFSTSQVTEQPFPLQVYAIPINNYFSCLAAYVDKIKYLLATE